MWDGEKNKDIMESDEKAREEDDPKGAKLGCLFITELYLLNKRVNLVSTLKKT